MHVLFNPERMNQRGYFIHVGRQAAAGDEKFDLVSLRQ